jgi:hypothetical protein
VRYGCDVLVSPRVLCFVLNCYRLYLLACLVFFCLSPVPTSCFFLVLLLSGCIMSRALLTCLFSSTCHFDQSLFFLSFFLFRSFECLYPLSCNYDMHSKSQYANLVPPREVLLYCGNLQPTCNEPDSEYPICSHGTRASIGHKSHYACQCATATGISPDRSCCPHSKDTSFRINPSMFM